MASLNPPLSAGRTSLAKWLLKYVVRDTLKGLEDLFIDGVSQVTPPDDAAWRYVVAVWTRQTPVGTIEDTAQIGLNVVNMTSGAIDSTWTDGDYTAVNAALTELDGKITGISGPSHTLREWRYYVRQFNPDLPWGTPAPSIDPATGKEWKRFARSGSPTRILTRGTAGGATAEPAAYQTAMSVTFKTAARKHWGRVYLPGITEALTVGQYGRFQATTCQTIADAFAEFIDDLHVAGFELVVPSTQQDAHYESSLMSISAVQVDDIPDVIRRRRPKQALSRSIGVATP